MVFSEEFEKDLNFSAKFFAIGWSIFSLPFCIIAMYLDLNNELVNFALLNFAIFIGIATAFTIWISKFLP